MSYQVEVRAGNLAWQKTISNEELSEVRGYLQVQNKPLSLVQMLVIPARTNSLKNCTTDTLYPMTHHVAMKVNSFIFRSIFAAATAVVDLISLPCRVITLLPRIVFNAMQKELPIVTYLKGQKIDYKIISSEALTVKLITKTNEAQPVVKKERYDLVTIESPLGKVGQTTTEKTITNKFENERIIVYKE